MVPERAEGWFDSPIPQGQEGQAAQHEENIPHLIVLYEYSHKN